jgi:3-oxoacyl-(acyl-carrier-protein) synthase
MMGERVAISGMGAICAAGASVGEILESVGRGVRNVGPITRFSTGLPFPGFQVADAWIPDRVRRSGQRSLALTLAALDEALLDSGWTIDRLRGRRVGVCIGTTVASQLNDIDFYRDFRLSGHPPIEPVDRYLAGNLADVVARQLAVHGPCATVVNACSSGTDALGLALSWFRADLCEIAIAGGGDEMNPVPYCGFASLGVASRSPCAPFDRDRSGLNLGEGAGIVVMETERSFRARGGRPRVFVAGYGTAGDAHHLTAPNPEGVWLETAICGALRQAGISPEDVAFVNAHGTATRDNDRAEGTVLSRVFGCNVKVVGTKGYTGHALGAAGGLEAIFTAAGLRDGWIPATAGFVNQDGEIPLTPSRENTRISGRFALSTSLAFGGNNSAIALGRVE